MISQRSAWVSEVAGVDAPAAIMGSRHDCTGSSGLLEDPVNFGAAPDQLTEAELADLRRASRHCRVLAEFATRVEG
jgi:hypothetical protein